MISRKTASEEKNKEHTPILIVKEAFKGKTVDVFKGSIESGVKEWKRTERDHDGSDFVYPKQKKEINSRDYSTG